LFAQLFQVSTILMTTRRVGVQTWWNYMNISIWYSMSIRRSTVALDIKTLINIFFTLLIWKSYENRLFAKKKLRKTFLNREQVIFTITSEIRFADTNQFHSKMLMYIFIYIHTYVYIINLDTTIHMQLKLK